MVTKNEYFITPVRLALKNHNLQSEAASNMKFEQIQASRW